MSALPRPRPHFVFAVLQSGLTSAVASLVASWSQVRQGDVTPWLTSWLIAWGLMIPLVLLAAPLLQKLAQRLSSPQAE